MPSPRLRRLARWTAIIVVLLAVAAWLGRDLPRRLVEKKIGELAGGEARLAALEWPAKGLFVLRGLEIDAPALSPALRRIVAERIEARASWAQLRRLTVGEVTIFGLAGEVDPARPFVAASGEESAAAAGNEPPFGLLVVTPGARARFVDARGAELAAAEFTAELAGAAGYPGHLAARLRGVDLADLELVLPLALPEEARRLLAGLALGEIELDSRWDSAGGVSFAGKASAGAWQEAYFRLQGEEVAARVRGLDLGALGGPDAPLEIDGRADLEIAGTLTAGTLRLELSPFALDLSGQKAALGPTLLAGRYDRSAAGLRLQVDQLAAELQSADAVPAEVRPLLPLRLGWRGELDLSNRSAAGDGELASVRLGSFPFTGKLSVAAGLDLQLKTPRLPLAKLLELLPPDFAPRPVGSGFLSGAATIKGQPAAAAVAAELRFVDLAPLPEVAGLSGTSRLRWSAAAPLAVTVDTLTAKTRLQLPLEGMAPVAAEVELAGDADLAARRFRLRGLKVATAELGRVEGTGELTMPEDYGLAGARAAGRLALRDVAADRWLALLGPAALPAGMSFRGGFSASPEVAKAPGGPWQAHGGWRLDQAGFASQEGDRVLEGLSLTGDFTAEAAPALAQGDAYRLSATGKSSGFQLLWGTLFGDFQKAAVEVKATAGGTLGGGPSLGAEVALGDGFTVATTLDPRQQYRLDLAAPDLDAVRRNWLLPLFQSGEPPQIAGSLRLQAEGGLPAKEGDPFTARGELALAGGRVAQPGLLAEGLELLLPFDLRAHEGVYSGPRLQGRLAGRRLAIGSFTLPAVASRVWVEADAAGLEEPVAIAFAGGEVRLDKVAARNLLAPAPRLETAIAFSGIALAELAAGAGALPIEGRLDGSLPRVAVEGQKLEVEGGGKVALFGGEVEIGGISGSDVFSAYPRLRLSARFHDIDLGLVTRRFDFGEMHGIVEGEVENLVLFRNLPLSFSARMVSVEKKGVQQTIDVKAVKNLTILGTGSAGSSPLDRGIQRFFKRYNYAALGISAQLANDVLLLRGLEQRGGRELFLRGRLPFSIDVVNAQPGKTVAFLAMVRRLKSLDLGGARTTP